MKKVNCAATVLAAIVGLGATPAMASVPTPVSAGLNAKIASMTALPTMTAALSSQQQQQQQQQQQVAPTFGMLFAIPDAGFSV